MAFLMVRDLLQEGGHPHPQSAAGEARDAIGRDDGSANRISRAGRPAGPHRALLSPAEWAGIWDSMPEDGAERSRWRELLTAHPSPPETPEPVNINTASEETLRGLLGPQGRVLAARILRTRESMPYRSIPDVRGAAEPQRLRFLDVRSRWFNIRVEARAADRGAGLLVTAVRSPEGSVRVIRWEWTAVEASVEGAEPDGLVGG